MDKLLKLSLLGAAAFVASNAAPAKALAADLIPEPPVIEVPEVVQKKVGGWYIRGDIGYSWLEQDGYYYNPSVQSVIHGADVNTDDAFALRGGIGYQINQNFRVDATVGYKFSHGIDGTTGPQAFAPIGCEQIVGTVSTVVPCDGVEHVDATRLDVMANAYVDLGTFGGLTPYVGAGIGGSYVSYDDLTNTFDCTNATPITIPAGSVSSIPCGQTFTHPGDGEFRFAYALHAGASYDISHQVKLDFGYTYTHVEGGKLAGIDTTAAVSGPLIHDKGFSDHTVTLGLRYHMW